MPDLFRLRGTIDVDASRAEANLRRVEASAQRTARGARQLAGEFDKAGSAAGNFGNKLSNVSSALNIAGGNLLASAISSVTGAMTGWVRAALNTTSQTPPARPGA